MTERQETPKTEPLLLRVDEAARMLGLGRSTVYELVEREELPSVRCGRARRIPLDALRAWVKEHTTGGT